MGEIGRLTFIHRLGISKRIRISQFWCQTVKVDDLQKFGEYRSSNSGV